LQRAATFLLVLVGLTLFRAPGWKPALAILSRLFVPHAGVSVIGAATLGAMLVIAAGFAHFGPNTFELSHNWQPAKGMALAALFFLCLFVIYGAKSSPFIYFQF
jgi:hypothetical protein